MRESSSWDGHGRERADHDPGSVIDALTRRSFISRSAIVAAAAALAELPSLLGAKGLLAQAQAITPDVVNDTLSGLLAFILPGNDAYSIAQGQRAPGPGSIGAGTLGPFRTALDDFVAAPALGQYGTTVPVSGGVAMLLNDYALQVDPAASSGAFLSPFARLSFKQKAEVFRRFEADETISNAVPEIKFVAGILPGFVAFMSFSEAGVYDTQSGKLAGTPVGWRIANYGGPAEGHAELKGYYQGRRSVRGTARGRRRRGGRR